MEPEEQNSIPFGPLQSAVEHILTRYHQSKVAIERATLLTDPQRRNRLWRCQLQAADRFVPQTVIIKQVGPEGYDPSSPQSWDTGRFFNDWAGAQFLHECAPDEGHGPAFYGGDVQQGFIILEDMGEHTSLVEPLLQGDAASASEALIAFARRLGRMHAASVGKEQQYRQIQRQISPAWAEMHVTSAESAPQAKAKQVTAFAQICTRLGVEPTQAAMQELGSLLQRLAEVGPFRTFLHGDPCPDNVFYRAPQLRLIDFEFSSFGHALKDGLYGRLPFPTCWCANTVPSRIVETMENTYRTELSSTCPEALDDQRFTQEACAVAASWVLGSMQWHLETALERDEEWGIAGIRARLLTRMETFLATARSGDQVPALCETHGQLLSELQRRWPEATPLPVYPAFR
jgi:hypothetical protein